MYRSFREVYEAAQACQACALAKTRKSVVFGEGSAKSGLMLIGEGPGEREDCTGRPFVGPAGQLLDKMIAAIGLARQDVYLSLIHIYVKINGEEVYLTSKQFDLLFFLYRHKGQVFTKEQIYENVWGYDNAPDASNLSSFIRKLRLKIEPHPDNPQYIITVWGVGYKFSGEEKP